jgi:regulator of protease activity HflC (stomatin/prohibitin superfamily)
VKVTVAGQARVTDPVAFVTAVQDAGEGLYLAIQVALREVLAGTPVDALLGGRADLGPRLAEAARGIDELGLAAERLEIKDVILPGELKKAQALVHVARAQGLATLERARSETAALRSLANAARMAADNPALVQLRLLQQLDGSAGHTVVIGTPAATPG